MKAKVTPINQRIALQLNVAIAFEALILHRLRRLPKARRDDWLRGLLVQGFQRECRLIKKLQRTERSTSEGARPQDIVSHSYDTAAKHQISTLRSKTNPQSRSAGNEAQRSDNTVSFAALRKVIG